MRNLLITLGIYILLVSFVTIVSKQPVNSSMHYFGVPKHHSLFADMFDVLSAYDCNRPYEYLMVKHCLDKSAPFNYPRVAFQLGKSIGLSQSFLGWLAPSLILLFIVSYIYIFKNFLKLHYFYVGMLICSPVTMLAIHRANFDLLFFILIVISSTLAFYKRYSLSISLILTAGFLKIYPIFGILSLYNKKSIRYFIFGIIAFIAYALLTIDDLLLISNATPRGFNISSERNVITDYFSHHFVSFNNTSSVRVEHSFTLVIALFIPFVYNYVSKKHDMTNIPSIDINEFESILFLSGASIYAGVFLIGNNWDYRLVFLHMTVPFLMRKARERDYKVTKHSILSLIMIASWSNILITQFPEEQWYRPIRFMCVLFEEPVQWVLFTFTSTTLLRYVVESTSSYKLKELFTT